MKYKTYLQELISLTKDVKAGGSKTYLLAIADSRAKQALYDNLDHDEDLAIAVYDAVEDSRKAKWLGNTVKENQIRYSIKDALEGQEKLVEQTFEIVKKPARIPQVVL